MNTILQLLQFMLLFVELILVLYFATSIVYVFIFAIAGHTYKTRRKTNAEKFKRIAVFIPAYKEDAVIVEVAKTALYQTYPSHLFDVIIIADSLQCKTLQNLKSLPIKVVEVSFQNSTKTKALNAAMLELDRVYDYAVILDADNVMEPYFLSKMNTAFNMGFCAVQGHRKAKNLNTTYAILDAASEEINNHIYRKGHVALGFSSGLIGSGMGFEYTLFKSVMSKVKAVGGFDKELEFELAKKDIKIEYLQDAVVLDEKVQKASDFSKQRRRWLATQFIYLKKYFRIGVLALFSNGNIILFDKVFQMLLPPRVLLLGVTVLITLGYLLFDFGLHLNLNVSSFVWVLNLVILVLGFVLSLPLRFYNRTTFRAMVSLPSTFLKMFVLLFKLKGANTTFIHTSHGEIKN